MAKLLSISFPIFFTSNLNRADKAASDNPACDPKTNQICPRVKKHYKTRNLSSDQEPLNINQAFHSAAKYQSSSRLRKAKSVYQNILVNDPYHPVALYNLALIEQKIGNKNDVISKPSKSLYLMDI